MAERILNTPEYVYEAVEALYASEDVSERLAGKVIYLKAKTVGLLIAMAEVLSHFFQVKINSDLEIEILLA